MGLLKNGEWIGETPGFTSGVIYLKHHGLSSTPINNWITKDGSAGPSGKAGFKAESGRYHLYHSPGCPFSHRAMEILKIKDLEEHISVSIVSPDMYNNIGWKFDKEDMSTGDHLFQEEFLRDIYVRHDSNYTGEVSVPLLWDKRDDTAVSKESNDIFKMLNSAFNDITGNSEDYVNATSDDPECSEEKFGFLCKWIFEDFCFNIYKVGYHPSDQGYQEACLHFFEQMDKLEEILSNRINSGQQFIFGDKDRSLPTLADFYLFNVLIRFDVAYYFH